MRRLLVEHYQDEEDGLRDHVDNCACCNVAARLLYRLRVDLQEMVGELLDELDRRGRAA
jgi:hypothetical protein